MKVALFGGASCTVPVTPVSKVLELKHSEAAELGIPAEEQEWTTEGHDGVLRDSMSTGECNLSTGGLVTCTRTKNSWIPPVCWTSTMSSIIYIRATRQQFSFSLRTKYPHNSCIREDHKMWTHLRIVSQSTGVKRKHIGLIVGSTSACVCLSTNGHHMQENRLQRGAVGLGEWGHALACVVGWGRCGC